MGFWLYMLLALLLIPVSMIGLGYLFIKHPPREVNAIYGYRTKRSMKNRETWEFAHRFCGRLWLGLGLLLLPVSLVPMLFVMGASVEAVGSVGLILIMLQLAPMVLSFLPTEYALKKHFDKDGRRRVEP